LFLLYIFIARTPHHYVLLYMSFCKLKLKLLYSFDTIHGQMAPNIPIHWIKTFYRIKTTTLGMNYCMRFKMVTGYHGERLLNPTMQTPLHHTKWKVPKIKFTYCVKGRVGDKELCKIFCVPFLSKGFKNVSHLRNVYHERKRRLRTFQSCVILTRETFILSNFI